MISKFASVNVRPAAMLLAALLVLCALAPAESKAADKTARDSQIKKHLAEGKRQGKDGEYKAAIAEYQKVLDIDPKNVDAHNYIGVAYFKLNDLDTAVSYYTKAADGGIANATTYFFRGIIYQRHKHEDAKAVNDFTKAIQIQPKFIKAYLNRALAYTFLKKHQKAIADYNTVAEMKPAILKEIILSRAEAYFNNGEYEKSWADVEKAKELKVKVDQAFVKKLQEKRQKSGK